MINVPFKTLRLTILLFYIFQSSFGQSHTVEFSGNGILTSAPPQIVTEKSKLIFKVNCSKNFLDKRVKEAIEIYLTAMDNIKSSETYGYIDGSTIELFKVKCALGKQINTVAKYLSTEDQAIIQERLIFLDHDEKNCSTDKTVPLLINIIQPSFKLDIIYYDKNGNQKKVQSVDLDVTGTIDGGNLEIKTSPVDIEKDSENIKFELREVKPINAQIQLKLKEATTGPQQSAIVTALKAIKSKMDLQFVADYSDLKARADYGKKFFTDPAKYPINASWVAASEQSFTELDKTVNSIMANLQQNAIKSWFLNWMWLTKGVPSTNPFDYQTEPLFPSPANPSSAKVTEKEKALVEMFDAMVAKEAFKLTSLSPTLDKDLEAISEIKARIKAESKVIATNNDLDIYWYSGLIKITGSTVNNYMISHDAANQYQLMTDPLKEVTEKDRVTIFTQNKKEGETTKIQVIPSAILSDLGKVTDEIDKSFLKDEAGAVGIKKNVLAFLTKYISLNKKIEFLQSLKAAPKLPILFTKSSSPVYRTEPLNYNTVFDAPQRIDYTLNTGTTEQPAEVFKGTFRVNKFYNIRFKAGMVFSNLKMQDYTKNSDNSFSLTEERAGIDGTFGVQIFFKKTDIRNINIGQGKVSPFLFAGFSMKDITGNFYPGIGIEIFSGVSLAYVLHIGKTEVLTGNGDASSQIEHKWVTGNGISLLVDGAFFVNLFKFGSNKSLLEL